MNINDAMPLIVGALNTISKSGKFPAAEVTVLADEITKSEEVVFSIMFATSEDALNAMRLRMNNVSFKEISAETAAMTAIARASGMV